MYKYPLAVSSWDDAEIKAIHKVIEDGITTMWDKVKAFEAEFASYIGSKYCVMVNSGSSANLLAVAALFYRKNNGLKAGDEVIVPDLSWVATASVVKYVNAEPVFADILAAHI